MASLLVIDWDQRQFHLAAVRTQRKGMQVEWVADWEFGEDLTPRCAEAVGKRLRDFLKAEGVSATSALVAIARDRVLLKDVRFPSVAAGEEAALVRFQATKDATEPPDTLEVDYVHRPGLAPAGEKQALAVLARKELVTAVRALCRGAGLKLLAVAPRPFGAPSALERSLAAGGGSLAADRVQGVLSVGARWAELCLFRGTEILLARTLPAGTVLVGEVRRSLAVFAAQNAADPALAGPAVLYVFGNGQASAPALAEALPCPVEVVAPLTIADAVAPHAEHQAALAGGLGLAQQWASQGRLPVNLAAPKRSQAGGSPARRRWLVYGIAAGVLLALGIASMYYTLSVKKGQIARLAKEKTQIEEDLRFYAQDRADIDALKEWEQGAIPWLDELYDLTARFPYEKGFHINHFSVEPVTAKKGAKDVPAARVRITGVAPITQDALVRQLRDAINRDGHLKAVVENIKGGTAAHEFTIRIDVTRQAPGRYETVLVVPAEAMRNAGNAGSAGKRAARGGEGGDE